jgi:hypothetical protein
MEQVKVGTNDLLSVAKKKVAVAATSVSYTEAFSMVGLALQLEVPTVAATSIHARKVGGVLELWPGWTAGGDGSQYLPKGGGSQYPPGGGGSGHIGGCPATGDPPHGITGGGPV